MPSRSRHCTGSSSTIRIRPLTPHLSAATLLYRIGSLCGRRLNGGLKHCILPRLLNDPGRPMIINRGRRQFLHALGSAAVWPLAAPARAEDQWPSRPVTVLCPFAAGTSTDTLLRLVTASLTDGFGQNFIVE